MVNDIIDGIVIKIDSIFGDSSVIYTESIEQDFQEPCFYIQLLTTSNRLVFNNRYYLENSFDIHYFPGTTNKNHEMNEIASRLYQLEYINKKKDSLLRGTKLKYRIIDEVLHFFIDYNFYSYLTKEEVDKMQSIKVK
jgi:hypothetical protein